MLKETLLEIVNIDYETKHKDIEIYGQNITTKALSIYNKFKKNKKTIVVFTEDKKEAEELFSIIFSLEKNTYLYPEIDILKRFDERSKDLEYVSLEILENLILKKPIILILPIISIFRTLKKPEDFSNRNIKININSEIDPLTLQRKLVEIGYKKVNSVDLIGEFAVRGSIVDIYSPLQENPIRIDFFDSEIDSIRIFDILSQRSLEKIEDFIIYPTGDFFLSKNEKEIIVNKINDKLKDSELKKQENFLEVENYIREKIDLFYSTGDFSNLSSFSNMLYKNVYSVVDYLPNDSIIVFDNYSKILEKIESLKEYFILNLENINRNYIYQDVIDDKSFDKLLSKENIKYYYSILKYTNKKITKYYNLDIINLEFFNGENYLASEIKEKIKNNYKIIFSLNNDKEKDYLEKILFDNYFYDDIFYGIKPGKIYIEKNKLYLKGFESKKDKILLITSNELFKNGNSEKKKRVNFKNSNSEKIRNYQDLNIGDYIVHISHGIGIYQGIENVEVSGVYKDFLKIVYEGGDIIYVDIHNMNYIQKYTASTDNRKPQLNKLGTKNWQKVKSRVKKEIEDISEDLIRLYIKRELSKGYSFSYDTTEQIEFEMDFPYVPTEDQLKATEEIKKDMEKERPMDRLLCGDVGFGKTEVAMRVAFKAIMDNKQVAVLVPTTLLAEQHYENFVERFANFPINISVVSRFNTAKNITEICKKLEEGKIDIIIGTHKLLNDKFKYRDLGLLIIDEEQRFGVKHKEKIKYLKNSVDVLTLSATPIPRTLHMSLIGIRDLSVIETPPRERQPIQTFVTSENSIIVKEAILNEVERGGQVFYVYNRVESIEEKYLELKKLLPDINIAYAHGRMTQKELESIMIDLIDKKYDVLITTTIIETGIDISNVNTLIVEDADKFGLSQLYQLRGRVGRSSREAYAYLMYKPFKSLTETSEKRLSAIKNFTTLGSGFKIAMQDLSIRGAGDVLGGRQHGFIDSVGYTLYSQMLEKELLEKKEILEPILEKDKTQDVTYYENIIKEKLPSVKTDIFEVEKDTFDIKLNVDAFIPKDYIQNDADKIEFYKRLNNVVTNEELEQVVEDLIDRYSDFGYELENLIDICYLKIVARKTQVLSIKELANKIVVEFDKNILSVLNGKKLFESLSKYKEVRIVVKDGVSLEVAKDNDYSIRKLIKILYYVEDSINKGEDNNE